VSERPEQPTTPDGDRLTGKDAARVHLGLVLCLAICIPAFIIEVARAIGGNSLSWAYVFEWPILAGFGVYMWWKLLHPNAPPRRPTVDGESAASDDADLLAWNRYLVELQEHDEGTS
jgi:hypothetical protein